MAGAVFGNQLGKGLEQYSSIIPAEVITGVKHSVTILCVSNYHTYCRTHLNRRTIRKELELEGERRIGGYEDEGEGRRFGRGTDGAWCWCSSYCLSCIIQLI